MMKRVVTVLFVFCLPCVSEGVEMPYLTRWYGGADAAVSLRFDDSHPSQIRYVLPSLRRYNMKGTFMVNPGKQNYEEWRYTWEKEIPGAGHELGNHTMHHQGAADISEAKYEIGEAWSRISALQGGERLMVFAAGGGTEWDGKLWEGADRSFKDIVDGYGMIDLYDGRHPTKHVRSTDTPEELCQLVNDAVRKGRHQAFTFHYFGSPDLKDRLRMIMKGYSLTYRPDRFEEFLKCLSDMNGKVWVAPLSDIYKYEAEYSASRIEGFSGNREVMKFSLKTGTDSDIYDHPVTVVVPLDGGEVVDHVKQNGKPVNDLSRTEKGLSFDVVPVKGDITVELR